MINGIIWAGVVMLFDYSMWSGGFIESYFNSLKRLPNALGKALGLCRPCFGFWFGIPFFLWRNEVDYVGFLGISEMILIIYQFLFLFLNKK